MKLPKRADLARGLVAPPEPPPPPPLPRQEDRPEPKPAAEVPTEDPNRDNYVIVAHTPGPCGCGKVKGVCLGCLARAGYTSENHPGPVCPWTGKRKREK